MEVDLLIDYLFDAETKNKTPQEFTEKILKNKLGVKAIVVGDNFHFGKEAKGNISTLRELGNNYGFEVYSLPLVEYAGSLVSSTRIRHELDNGNIEAAHNMLNY